MPSVSVPVLSNDQGIDPLEDLERLGVLDQDARAGPAARPDHDRHRRRQPEGARAGDDQDGDGIDQGMRQPRLRADRRPGDERDRRATRTTAGTKYPETTSARRWIGARVRCASLTIRTIWASIVSAPTRSARMTRPPVPLTVPPMTRSPGPFSTGIGSPVIIDSSTALGALEHDAVDRDLLARPDPQPIARDDLVERDVFLAAVVAEPPRGLGRQAEQGPDRAAGLAARPQLEHLPQQDERRDHRRRLEVDRDLRRDDRGTSPGRGRERSRRPR